MWLFTQFGFFSIVRKKAGEFHVRARIKQDLENLVRHVELASPIIVTKQADYRYRIVTDADSISRIMRVLAERIDYDNFKGRIGKLPDQRGKSDALHRIWEIMEALQEEPDRAR